MIRNSIVYKLSITIVSLSLILIFPLGFTINKIFSSFYYQDLETQLDELATNYTKLITTLEDPSILNLYETLGHMINREIFIVNDEGVVVVNSGFPQLMEGTKIFSQDMNILVNGESIHRIYQDPQSQERYLSVGKPIFKGNQFIGGIFISASINGIYQSIDRVEKMIILASVGSVLISMGFALFLSRRLSSPLLKMEEATRNLAKGDLNSRVHLNSKDEIGTLANAINDLAIELQRYRTNRREFFANISHELRTPLTYIDGFTNALRKKLYKSEEEKQQMLLLIDQESKRMTKLVNDLFELAKMEEEKILLQMEPIDLMEIIEVAVNKTKLKAKEKNLYLEVKEKEQLPAILGDGYRLEQILINLIENAIRYTEAGKITIKTWDTKDHVHLTIKDTGIGIPEEQIPHLFERFYRVDKSRSRKLGGTGLGLAIVKQLILLHHGKINVTSTIGQGSTFEMKFPVIEGRK